MAYNNAIPQPNDRLSDSQNDILVNFAGLETWATVNHSSVGSAVGTLGQHNYVTFIPSVIPAGNILAAGKINLFVDSVGPTDISMQKGVGSIYPISKTTSSSGAALGGLGYMYMVNQRIMIWGTLTIGGGGTVTRDVNNGAALRDFASETALISLVTVQITPTSNNLMYVSNIQDGPNYRFTVTGTAGGTCMYMVIGLNAGSV